MTKEENISKSIRFRLFLQTVLTIAPVIILIIYINIVSLRNSKQIQLNQLRNSAKHIATENTQIIEGARQLLITLSTSDYIKYPNLGCSKYLSEVISKYQRYSNIALTDAQGNVICSANAPQTLVNVSDRYFFNAAINNKDFSVGEYSISRVTGDPIISLGYPIYNSNGILTGVVYSSLDLQWLKNFSIDLGLNNQAVLMLLDRNGAILVKVPDSNVSIGKKYFKVNLIKDLVNKKDVIEFKEKNSEKYYYAFQKIGLLESNPYAVVGLPESVVFSQPNIDFRNNLFLSIIISLASIIAGWFIGQSLITHVVFAMGKVDQLKKDFVSLVSHQLRTPLTAIKYFSEILLSGSPGELKSKQKEFLLDIHNSTNRLISLVGTLLNISRIESGKIKLHLQKVSLPGLIKSCQSEINHLFIKKNLKFVIKNYQSAGAVFIDVKLIRQVINNLLTNAAKYSYPKSSIEAKIIQGKKEVTVSIKNHGFGISHSEKPNIFSKFFRSEAARKADQEGSGLGLYLSKLIVEMHQGKIWYTSSSKTGTAFFFTLPV